MDKKNPNLERLEFFWWRRRDSNSRPGRTPKSFLHVYLRDYFGE